MSTEGGRLAMFARAVRESTLKRLRRVPPGRERWRPDPGASSFLDLAVHLADADDWLFGKLADPTLEPVTAVRRVEQGDLEAAIARLVGTGERRVALLAALTAADLARTLPDRRFGGDATVWWIVVRGNLDHEIHHRGQIAAYLRAV